MREPSDYFHGLKGSHLCPIKEVTAVAPETTKSVPCSEYPEGTARLSIVEESHQLHRSHDKSCEFSREYLVSDAIAYLNRPAATPKERTASGDDALSYTALDSFKARIQASATVDGIVRILKEFSQGDWTLLERAAMSSAYTPVARKLIAAENLDKHRTLEDLAVLCWNKPEPEAAINISRPIAINSRPLDDCYPGALPADTVLWIIDAVKAGGPGEQKEWWLALGRWLAKHDDFDWANSAYEQLSARWDEVLR